MSFIKVLDVQGDTSHIRRGSIDCIVGAEHVIPIDPDNATPIVELKDDEKKLKFFVVLILGNGRQVMEGFDCVQLRDERIRFLLESCYA